MISVSLALCLILPSLAERQPVPPVPLHYVTDETGFMDRRRISSLDDSLFEYSKKTGHQVVVYVTMRKPPKETIESFARATFDAWGVGRRGADDGVLLLVLLMDKQMRVEVGAGLGNIITARRAERVISVMRANFQAGEFENGLDAGSREVMMLLDGPPVKPEQGDKDLRAR